MQSKRYLGTSLLVSSILHLILFAVWITFFSSNTEPQYKEITLILNQDPEPDPLPPEQDQVEPELPDEPLADLQPETEPEKVEELSFVEPTSDPEVPGSSSQPQVRNVPPPTISRQPTAEDLLGDVADLLDPPRTSEPDRVISDQQESIARLRSGIQPEASREDELAEQWQQENQVESLPKLSSRSTNQSANEQQERPSSSTIREEIAQLKQELQQQYATTNSQSDQNNSPPGNIITDERLSGDISGSGRSLVSKDRLNLQRYLSQKESTWPRTITVEFEVNREGLVTILNENDISRYTSIHHAVLRLFLDGPVFVPAPQAPRQRGSITFQLR